MIIGGDFNCVLSKNGCTGNINYSKALDTVVRGFGLIDLWRTVPQKGHIYKLNHDRCGPTGSILCHT